jgi:hypothetical protein
MKILYQTAPRREKVFAADNMDEINKTGISPRPSAAD